MVKDEEDQAEQSQVSGQKHGTANLEWDMKAEVPTLKLFRGIFLTFLESQTLAASK